jgi:UrcA family protein
MESGAEGRSSMLQSPSARLGSVIAALTVAAGVSFAPAPAPAQAVEEVTVVGRLDAQGRPQQLSRAVTYRDLDITTKAGQTALKARIEAAAKDLCGQLGEPDRGAKDDIVPTCRYAAVRQGMADMRAAVARAKPRAPGWTPPAL